MKEIQTILVTTDFSETSIEAFPLARRLAETFGARILLVHVEEDRLPPLVLEYTDVALEEIHEHQRETARANLARLAPQLGAEVEIEVQDGTPHTEIVRLAEKHDADLIVMATHGRGFFMHALLGSTTERVLRRAPCPVLVVNVTRNK